MGLLMEQEELMNQIAEIEREIEFTDCTRRNSEKDIQLKFKTVVRTGRVLKNQILTELPNKELKRQHLFR